MGQIRKHRSGFSNPAIIKDSFGHEDEIFYCQECKDELNKLYPRSNYFESDADQWLECHVCGETKHINELKHTSKLESFAVPSDNPYERKNIVLGLDNKRKKTSRERQREKLLEKIDKEKDEDIKQALKRGNTVEIIEDSLLDY